MILSIFLSAASFVGCAEKHTYAEVQELYSSIMTEYSGVFFDTNKKVSITYSVEMQNAINSAVEKKMTEQSMTDNEKQLLKLSNNVEYEWAVFEPTWDSTLKVTQSYMTVTIGTDKVPADRVNTMYRNLSTLKSSLNQMKIAKNSLEGYATQIDSSLGEKKFYSWLPNYYNRFFEVISNSSEFALDFAYAYRDFVIERTEVGEGRLQPNVLRLESIIKLSEFADIYQEIFLSQAKNSIVDRAPDFCIKLLESYQTVEDILKKDAFNNMSSTTTVSEEESAIVQAFAVLKGYSPIYLANRSSAYRVIQNFKIEDLRRESSALPLTVEEQSAIDKIDEFMQVDCIIVLGYLENINQKIKGWDDIYGL